LSLYRVHFKWREKEIQLTARSLDLTHPYFVSIKDLVFPDKKQIIINPSEDEIVKAFGGARHLMIPFQTVSLIEEMDEESQALRLRRFTLLEGKAQGQPADASEAAAPEAPSRESADPEDSRG
jgi:hypothetical protein